MPATRLPLVLVLFGALLSPVSTIEAQPPTDLSTFLPAEAGGWRPATRDAAYTPDSLFEYIDGGAELYISYGVRRMLSRRYVTAGQKDATITVDVFDMGAAANAFGLYSHSREKPTDEIGQGSEYAGGLLFFWKGRYFVSILGFPASAEVERTVKSIGTSIAAAIRETGTVPAIVTSLPPRGLVARSVRYFRHYIWLNSHAFISDENILQMADNCEGVLARYQAGAASWVLLVVRYPDAASAEKAHASFTAEYLPDATRGVARKPDGKWAGCALQEDRIVAVLEAPDEKTVRQVLGHGARELPE
jgi:hypothetical protein